MADPITPASTTAYAAELRRNFQDDKQSFTPIAGQLVLDAQSYEGWACTAYDSNTDKSVTWTLPLNALTADTLKRTDDKKNFTLYQKQASFWYSPREAGPESAAANYLRAFRIDGKEATAESTPEVLRLVVEHTLVGATNYITTPTFDPTTGDKRLQGSPSASSVAAYSVCEAKKKAE